MFETLGTLVRLSSALKQATEADGSYDGSSRGV